MAQSLKAAAPHVSNDPVTIFANEAEAPKGSTKVKKSVSVLDTHPATQREQTTENTTEQTPATQHQHPLDKEALAARGLKRCSQHLKLLDRLNDADTQPLDGHPVDVRPLDAFGRSSFTKDGKQTYCKACDHVLMRDARARTKATAGTTPDTLAKKEALVATLTAQYNALAARINALEFEIRQAKEEEHAGTQE